MKKVKLVTKKAVTVGQGATIVNTRVDLAVGAIDSLNAG